MLRKFVSGVLVACALVGVTGCSHDDEQDGAAPVTESVTNSNGQVTEVTHQNAGLEKFTDKQCSRIITDILTLQHMKLNPDMFNYDNPTDFERYLRQDRLDLSDPVEHKWFYKAKPDPFSASLHRQVKDLCPTEMYNKEIAYDKKHSHEFVWKA